MQVILAHYEVAFHQLLQWLGAMGLTCAYQKIVGGLPNFLHNLYSVGPIPSPKLEIEFIAQQIDKFSSSLLPLLSHRGGSYIAN